MSVIFNELGGGVNYVSDTPPSSATEGQFWFKPTDNGVSGSAGLWVYRITQADPLVAYWVSATAYKTGLSLLGVLAGSTGNSQALGDNFFTLSSLLWIDDSQISFYITDRVQNATDHWDIAIGFITATNALMTNTIKSISTDTDLANNAIGATNQFINTVNNVITITSPRHLRYFHTYTKIGSNTNRMGLSGSITYREVHP